MLLTLRIKLKTVLQRKLSQLDVVSREEFDVQTQVLLKTREKLADLEAKMAVLEAKTSGRFITVLFIHLSQVLSIFV